MTPRQIAFRSCAQAFRVLADYYDGRADAPSSVRDNESIRAEVAEQLREIADHIERGGKLHS